MVVLERRFGSIKDPAPIRLSVEADSEVAGVALAPSLPATSAEDCAVCLHRCVPVDRYGMALKGSQCADDLGVAVRVKDLSVVRQSYFALLAGALYVSAIVRLRSGRSSNLPES